MRMLALLLLWWLLWLLRRWWVVVVGGGGGGGSVCTAPAPHHPPCAHVDASPCAWVYACVLAGPTTDHMVEGASCFSNINDGSLVVWSRLSLQLRKWRVSRVVQGSEQDVFYNENSDAEITWPPETVRWWMCMGLKCACVCVPPPQWRSGGGVREGTHHLFRLSNYSVVEGRDGRLTMLECPLCQP
jgi:hypothetical protein